MKRLILHDHLTQMIHFRHCHCVLSLKPIANILDLVYVAEPIYLLNNAVHYELVTGKEAFQNPMSKSYFPKKYARLIVQVKESATLKAKEIATTDIALRLGFCTFTTPKDLEKQVIELIMDMFGIDTWHNNESLILTNINYERNFYGFKNTATLISPTIHT